MFMHTPFKMMIVDIYFQFTSDLMQFKWRDTLENRFQQEIMNKFQNFIEEVDNHLFFYHYKYWHVLYGSSVCSAILFLPSNIAFATVNGNTSTALSRLPRPTLNHYNCTQYINDDLTLNQSVYLALFWLRELLILTQ